MSYDVIQNGIEINRKMRHPQGAQDYELRSASAKIKITSDAYLSEVHKGRNHVY